MNRARFLQKARFAFWTLLFVSYAALAAGVVIDTLNPQYRELSPIAMTSVASPEQTRKLGAAQAAAVYRASSGSPFTTLPAGSSFDIVWPDGTSETITIVDPASSAGTRPVPGSQQAAPAD